MVKDAKILILGFTFKENCPDIRNTKIVDVYHTLSEYTSNITVYDPWADKEKAVSEYGIAIVNDLPEERFDAIILGVAHRQFEQVNLKALLREGGVVYDVKGVLPRDMVDDRL